MFERLFGYSSRTKRDVHIYIYAKFGQAVEPDRRSGAISFGLNGREVG